MKSNISYLIAGAAVFAMLWFFTHPHIALSLVAAPLLGVGLAWAWRGRMTLSFQTVGACLIVMMARPANSPRKAH